MRLSPNSVIAGLIGSILTIAVLFAYGLLNQRTVLWAGGFALLLFCIVFRFEFHSFTVLPQGSFPPHSRWKNREPLRVQSFYLVCATACLYTVLRSFGPISAWSPTDAVIRWGFTDKRFLVQFYALGLVLVTLASAWDWRIASAKINKPGVIAGSCAPVLSRAPILTALSGFLVVLLAFVLIVLPVIKSIRTPPLNLQRSLDIHRFVQLAVFEEMRQGAVPYISTDTQYGLGNTFLMFKATESLGFTNQGFYTACILINSVCILVLFTVTVLELGPSWGAISLLGWIGNLLPSPAITMSFAGWAIYTRWVGVPLVILAVISAFRRELSGRPSLPFFALSGAVWGGFSVLSQENLSGGALALIVFLLLIGPAIFIDVKTAFKSVGVLFFAALTVYTSLIFSILGPGNVAVFLAKSAIKSQQVLAGISNTWWSHSLRDIQQQIGVGLTYGGALGYLLTLSMISRKIHRDWLTLSHGRKVSITRFGGIISAGAALHLFTLLRSDWAHLSGPSFLVPLAIPMALSELLVQSRIKYKLFVASVLTIIAPRMSEIGIAQTNPNILLREVIENARTSGEYISNLFKSPTSVIGVATRYASDPMFQNVIMADTSYRESEEALGLIRSASRGVPIEWLHSGINKLIDRSEKFYFFGGFRSVTGTPSRLISSWLRSEEVLLNSRLVSKHIEQGCLFLQLGTKQIDPILEKWRNNIPSGSELVEMHVVGSREFGFLSCRFTRSDLSSGPHRAL